MNGLFTNLSRTRIRVALAGLMVAILAATSLQGVAYAESEAPSAGSATSAAAARTYKWIEIDLSSQTLTAYQGSKVVLSTRVSTGTSRYPTVTGTFRVYSKIGKQRMRGGTGKDRYDLPNVPHVMYFHQAYAIHGAYWHNNFGRTMSHGCVNMNLGAAKWLYNWTPMSTTVVVHR